VLKWEFIVIYSKSEANNTPFTKHHSSPQDDSSKIQKLLKFTKFKNMAFENVDKIAAW